MEQLRAIGQIIPPIFLAVAAFLLHVLATRTVETEREQIGILKAFGYTEAAVGWHYLKFVLSMTLVGVAAGCLVGVLFGRSMTELYAEFYRFPFLYFRLSAGVFVTATAVSLAAGGVGALSAVRGAVRLAPAVAMQVAPPASYTRGGLETLAIVRSLSQPSRMIVSSSAISTSPRVTRNRRSEGPETRRPCRYAAVPESSTNTGAQKCVTMRVAKSTGVVVARSVGSTRKL